MPDKKILGAVIQGYLKFIKKIWGQEGVDECAKAVNFDPKNITEGRWYEIDLSVNILKWMVMTKGEEFVERCGNYTVKDLGVLSYIVRFAHIKSLLKRAPESYADAFNYGSLEVDIRENNAILTMKDTVIDEYTCQAWLGAFRGMLEVTKTKGSVKEKQCQLNGKSHCELLMEWE